MGRYTVKVTVVFIVSWQHIKHIYEPYTHVRSRGKLCGLKKIFYKHQRVDISLSTEKENTMLNLAV